MMSKRQRERAAGLVEDLLSETREELTRAEGKISILLAAASVVVGIICASLLGGEWSPSKLSPFLGWAWWIGCVCGGFGIASLGVAVFPRSKRSKATVTIVGYYEDVVFKKRRYDLEKALWQTAKNPGSRSLDQLEQISAIVSFKYRCLRASLFALACACIILVFVGVMAGIGFYGD